MSAGRVRWSLGSLALALITAGPYGAGSKPRLGSSPWPEVVYSRESEKGEMEAQVLDAAESIAHSILFGILVPLPLSKLHSG